MKRISTEEVMDNLYMFQVRFGEVDEFGWWELDRISVHAGMNFTSTQFQDECQTCGVWLTLAALYHQEMNGQVKVIYLFLFFL